MCTKNRLCTLSVKTQAESEYKIVKKFLHVLDVIFLTLSRAWSLQSRK